MRIHRKIFVLWLILYAQRMQTNLFVLKFSLLHKLQLMNVQHKFCSVMCYTVLIWTLILLTLKNNILLQSFNWPKPMHYIPTDKTRKRSNCACIATRGCPMPHRSFSALITTPMTSLKSLNLSVAVYSIFTVDSLHYALTYYLDKK